MPERRELTFSSLDRVMPDVDLLLQGHRLAGNWSLGQICNHLASALQYSVEGFPMRVPWPIRVTLGKILLRRDLRTGKISEGIKLPKKLLPKPGLDDRAEAEALRAAVRVYSATSDPLVDHPLFGRISRDVWDRLHCIHCAHHLSFLWPENHA